MEFAVRRQRGDEAGAVREVITAAFADDGRVADLAEALRRRSDRQCSLVAVERAETDEGVEDAKRVESATDEAVMGAGDTARGERVVGHVHLSISWVDAPDRLIEVLTLSPLAVAPARQRQGIGAALVNGAVEAADELGVPVVFLEGNPAYYGRLGWRPAGVLGFGRPSVRIPAEAFQAVPLSTYDPATMRGPVIYNDTFWSHDLVGLRP